MRILVLDTATSCGLIGCLENNQTIFEIVLGSHQRNSQQLFPELHQACQQHEIPSNSFDAIAIGVGPGSYTGIRVAVAAAQAIAFALQIPLLSFCSLQAHIPKENGIFWVLLDARIGGVYQLGGEKKGEQITWSKTPQLLDIDTLRDTLSSTPRIISPECNRVQQRLKKEEISYSGRWEQSLPQLLPIRDVIKQTPPKTDLSILYLRKTQAEM